MGEAPKRVWVMGATDDDGNDFLGTCWRTPDPRALEYIRADLADADYLAGVKAGLDAAGDAQHCASRALRQLGYSSFCDSLDECTRQIRALDPAAVAREAQKEKPNG